MTNKLLTTIVFSIASACYLNFTVAETLGEKNEPTPEYLDATFTSEDAARVAAGFSSEIIPAAPIDPLEGLSNAADLIFIGKVIQQSYSYDAADVPSTHTTFSVTEVLKGSYHSTELTLIQLGGPRKQGGGGLMVSTTRHFSVGEDELLLVNFDPDNSTLRNRVTVASRFRIYENQIYNEDGYGVIIEPTGRLTLSYDRHPSEHFKQIDMGTHSLVKQHGVDDKSNPDASNEAVRSAANSNQKSYTDSIDLNAFSSIIRE